MSYSIQDCKNDLQGVLHGTTNAQIQNLNGVINRAARQLLLDIDPQETKRTVEFVAPIFNSVFDYPIAADVKGNKIIDIFPQVQRLPWDIWLQSYNQAFDVGKDNIFSMANMFTLNFNTSLKTLRVNAPYLNPPVIIDQIDAIAVNGTWAAGGDASNLSVNNSNFAQGAGSLQFDIGDGTLGPELVTNGDFAGSAAGWTLQSGWTYGSNDVVAAAVSSTVLVQSLGTIPLGTYTLTFDATVAAGSFTANVRNVLYPAVGDNIQIGNPITADGTYTAQFTVTADTPPYAYLDFFAFTFTGTITNISLKRDLLGAGYIENSTLSSIDLSSVESQSSFFTWVYIPTASALTSVTLRWGSSSANYWEGTATQTQQGTSFVNGWNLCQFPWASATTTGAPDSSSISYARVSLAMTAAATAVKVNGLNSILGTILSYEYYSKYLFRNASTGAYQETVLDDSDLINLDTESFNLLFNQVAYLATQQQQGLDASFYDGTFFKNAYDQGVIRYKSMYKSELQDPQSTYYAMPRTGYTRYIGRGWGN